MPKQIHPVKARRAHNKALKSVFKEAFQDEITHLRSLYPEQPNSWIKSEAMRRLRIRNEDARFQRMRLRGAGRS